MRLKNGMTGFILITALIGGCQDARAATKQDLDNAIAALDAVAEVELSQGIEVINAINMAIAPRQSLTVGTVEGKTTVDIPVYFKASTSSVSSLQFDIVLSTGLTVTSVTPGIAALAAQKGVQGNVVSGGHRVLVFGVNQNAIPSGPIAILTVTLGGNTGKLAIPITSLAASDPSGSNVPVTGRQGTVTVR